MADQQYAVFPQFTSYSVVREDWEYEDPAAESTTENGWTDVRPTRSRGRFSLLRDTYQLSELDAVVLVQFLIAQRLRATPFQYTHPFMGTSIVRLKGQKFGGKMIVNGAPSWYAITLELEEQY